MKRLLSIVFIGVSLVFTLGLSARPEARPENTATFMVGTWEKVQAEPADPGKPNQERVLKMITPSHWMVLHIDLWTHKIKSAFGGPCSFGVGEYSEILEYATAAGSEPDPAKKNTFNIRKDDDRFIQSGRIGNTSFKETWKPAAPASKPAAAPGSPPPQAQPETTVKFMVGTWEMVPAKPAGPGNPDQERRLKMITPGYFVVMSIDTWTHKIRWGHGGPCSFGVGEYTEVIEYSLTGNPDPTKKWAFKIRKDGDRFIQFSGKIGDDYGETWKPAAPASKPAAGR